MMKEQKPKLLKSVLGIVLAGLAVVQPLMADTVPVQEKDIKQDAIAEARQAVKDTKTKYRAEAVAGLKAVEEAIALLDDGKKDQAVEKLEEASGELEVAMAANPELKLIPVGTEVFTHDLISTPETIKSELEAVDDLLEEGDVQAARIRMSKLRSEIVTNFVFLPLEIFPDAIQRAVREITASQSRKAQDTLAVAMDSLVEEVIVTPLPVMVAEGAINEAEEVQGSDKDEALRDLEYAASQIEIAKRLGYFYHHKAAYKTISGKIDALKHAIKGKSETAKLFDEAKASMSKLLSKFKSNKSNP